MALLTVIQCFYNNLLQNSCQEPTIPEEQYRRRERIHGEWERALALPDRVDEDGLTAELKEGLLKVHLPKLKQSASRQIPVITS